MKKILIFAIAAIALFASGQAAASDVTNISLSCADGSTMAAIYVDGAIRFTHQTEPAKDGKPFRVIVDILTASHRLSANNFHALPDCPVKAIRTSQYSRQPEAIVRVVFDMEGEQVYRVQSDANSIKLYFADRAKRSFAAWSSSGPTPKPAAAKPARKSTAELNNTIDKDRMASLTPQETAAPRNKAKAAPPQAVSKSSPQKVSSQQPSVWSTGDSYGPYVDASLLEKTATPSKPVAKPAAKPKATPEKKAPAKTVQQPLKSEAKPPAVKEKPQPTPVKAQKKPVLATVKANPASEPPARPTNVAEKPAQPEKQPPSRSTSRFRRSPVTSKKIKGTMVAEFPKRLVIKYKSKRYRDPFATLIDETKTYDNPVERQVPNVEGLKLVGVLQAGSRDNRALFEDKEGYGYILKTGDKVQKGYVLRVESDRVYFQIFEYGWSRTVALYLES